MKKIIVLFIILISAGCALKKEEPIIKALKELSSAKSYTVFATSNVENDLGKLTMKTEIKVDTEKEISYTKIQNETTNIVTEIYSEKEDGKPMSYIKSSLNDFFVKVFSEKDQIENILPTFYDKNKPLNYKKIETDDGFLTYEVTFENFEIMNLIDSENPMFDSLIIVFKIKNNRVVSFSTKLEEKERSNSIVFNIKDINKTNVSFSLGE